MANEDRLTALLEQPIRRVTGIDFIQVVDPDVQTTLRVYFLINPDELDDPLVETAALPATTPTKSVTIISISGGESLAEVPIIGATYLQVSSGAELRTVLEVQTAVPGDFSRYHLTIIDPGERIDRFFNGVEFSFKQGCPSVLDCRRAGPDCPSDEFVDVPIDYLARDFVSLRNALLDFAAQRYPQWSERIVADAGTMLAETMAALGDEFSYIQDRYGREAHLETASQRRSLRQHARLVDYPIHDGLSPATFLDINTRTDAGGGVGGDFVAAGSRVWAPCPGSPPIPFELGEGLSDTTADNGNPLQFWVHADWNEMPVHVLDLAQPCLPLGTTEVYLLGTFPVAAELPAGADPNQFWLGKWVLLRTDPEDPSLPARRHLVRINEIEHTTDPLVLDEGGLPVDLTRVRWEEAQALPFEMCLTDMTVRGNLIFATAGETITDFFSIRDNDSLPPNLAPDVFRAIERQGALDAVDCARDAIFLHSLRETESRGLGWLGQLPRSEPELELQEVDPLTLQPLLSPQIWQWQRTLLDARGFEDKFTLDDGTWRRVIGFRRIGEEIVHEDYASNAGFTVRFGDGEFGNIPPDGTVFRARYRTGPGSAANLPADTIVNLTNPNDATQADLLTVVDAVTNPLAISSGIDPEAAEVIKQIAPEAFRALTFRAVRPEDYAEIAERLPWVQRAGARFRWTGSWLSSFVTADPRGAFTLSAERRLELADLMDCVRQAGREVFVRNPRFINLDLEITICVEPFAYQGQVRARVLEALLGSTGARPLSGFFDPDNFTFGTPLRRAELEAAVQSVPGVKGVEIIRLRARGSTDWLVFTALTFEVADDQIIRLQNDPRFPERGSLLIETRQPESLAEETS